MRRFTFRLEATLTLRRRLEEQAQVQLAESERQREREQAQLAELQRERERHEICRAGLQRPRGEAPRPPLPAGTPALDVTALVEADRYSDALERALHAQEERLLAAHAAVDASRDTLQQRYRDREAVERLRARQLEEYRQEALRMEQAALDEAFVLRWKKG
jgi:flagellar biosynthesis chaperone FliJ